MGKIIRNGIEYSSTVDTANNISYDNSLSGLEATTTQKAIDELSINLNESLGEKYSTEEKVIGTWIDGKPLYRKVIVFDTFEDNTMISHNIPNVDHIHLGVGSCGYRNDGWIAGNFFVDKTDFFFQLVSKTQMYCTHIHANSKNEYNKFIFVLEYTKTTD